MKRFFAARLILLPCCLSMAFLCGISSNAFAQMAPAEPAAPVPAVVAIARPTADEIQLAERTLAKFLETADPAVREIQQKYPGLMKKVTYWEQLE